jgi:hypothetical protein
MSAVDDVVVVEKIQGRQDLATVMENFFGADDPGGLFDLKGFADHLAQVVADVVHDEKGAAVLIMVEIVGRD